MFQSRGEKRSLMMFSIPVISNVTYIGSGQTAVVPGGDNNDRTFAIRDNAGGKYYNSVFTDFPNTAMNVEDKGAGSSQERLEVGDLLFKNNMFWGYGIGATFADIIEGDKAEAFISPNNSITDPQIAGIQREASGGLDPRPEVGSPALSGADMSELDASWFDQVDHIGAFSQENWLMGWTALSDNGFLGNVSGVTIEPISGEIPDGFALHQNYPNPFNPVTTIEFDLAKAQNVRLAVYDLLGREVALLAEGEQPMGTYRVQFKADHLSSGVYVYRLQLEGSVMTRTMTLLK